MFHEDTCCAQIEHKTGELCWTPQASSVEVEGADSGTIESAGDGELVSCQTKLALRIWSKSSLKSVMSRSISAFVDWTEQHDGGDAIFPADSSVPLSTSIALDVEGHG